MRNYNFYVTNFRLNKMVILIEIKKFHLNLMEKNILVTKVIRLASALLANGIHLVGRSF